MLYLYYSFILVEEPGWDWFFEPFYRYSCYSLLTSLRMRSLGNVEKSMVKLTSSRQAQQQQVLSQYFSSPFPPNIRPPEVEQLLPRDEKKSQ